MKQNKKLLTAFVMGTMIVSSMLSSSQVYASSFTLPQNGMVPIKTTQEETTANPQTDTSKPQQITEERQRQPIPTTAPEEGTQLAKILVDDTISPYRADGKVNRDNFAGAYWVGNIGQCTWYTCARFYEALAIDNYTYTMLFTPVGKSAGIPLTAWLDNADREDLPSVYSIRDAKKIVPQSIAVWTGDTPETATNGHVVFVEYVTYHANGMPAEVYFSEANYGNEIDGTFRPGIDGVIKKQNYEDFVKRSAHGTFKGYIAAK